MPRWRFISTLQNCDPLMKMLYSDSIIWLYDRDVPKSSTLDGYPTDIASSPGPTQKSGKGPGVTCKNCHVCCVSSLLPHKTRLYIVTL